VIKPETNLPFGHADCKKAVQSNFRTRANNRFVFSRDKDNEGCWIITPSPEEEKKIEQHSQEDCKYKPLHQVIADAIDEHGGSCYLEDIYTFVQENWHLKSPPDTADVDLKLQIRVSLSTNPKFVEDQENPDYYQISNKKKRRSYSKRDEYEKKPKNLELRSRRRSRSDDEDEPTRSRKPSATSAPAGPPVGYICRCGATEPGKGAAAKWRKGLVGEWLCNSCGLQWNKKHACPVCGKVYHRNNASDDDENSWIRCDDCHRWVMTKCDNIQDLSLYDDSNPNHLHYSCPICRGLDMRKNGNKVIEKSDDEDPSSEEDFENKLDTFESYFLDRIAEEYEVVDLSEDIKETLGAGKFGAHELESSTPLCDKLDCKLMRQLWYRSIHQKK